MNNYVSVELEGGIVREYRILTIEEHPRDVQRLSSWYSTTPILRYAPSPEKLTVTFECSAKDVRAMGDRPALFGMVGGKLIPRGQLRMAAGTIDDCYVATAELYP